MKSDLKDKAIFLRKAGYSYSHIQKEIVVSKSTLCLWLSDIPYKPNAEMLLKLDKARLASAQAKKNLKDKSFLEASIEAGKEVGLLSNRDLFMLGLGVYIGEGTKTHDIIRVIN